MNCFKYQVHLYGSEAITYFNAILGYRTSTMSHQTAPPSTTSKPPPPFFSHLKKNFSMDKLPYLCLKAKEKPLWLRNDYL